MSFVGNIYATPQQNPSKETQQSHDKLLKEAESGNPTAQFSLGRMYANGQGVKQDYAEAIRWYQKAADQGFATAQLNLGIMYENGRGIEQNYAEAVRWFQKAADQGDASAQFSLGIMHAKGRGVKKSYAKGIRWLTYKDNPIEEEIFKAKTREDFEKILLKLSLIDPFDNYRGEIIDIAIKIPPSKRATIFHFVQKSSIKPFNNKNYFDIYAGVPIEEIDELFKAASVFFSSGTTDYDRQDILRAFKSLKKEKRIKMSKYINSIILEPEYISSVIEAIISLPEEEMPDIIARTQMILGRVGEDGTSQLIRALRRIPKERRDFIMEEAQKLHQEGGKALGKVLIIEGLMKLDKDDFRQIVDLSQQLFLGSDR